MIVRTKAICSYIVSSCLVGRPLVSREWECRHIEMYEDDVSGVNQLF